jgi:hypothetical protein
MPTKPLQPLLRFNYAQRLRLFQPFLRFNRADAVCGDIVIEIKRFQPFLRFNLRQREASRPALRRVSTLLEILDIRAELFERLNKYGIVSTLLEILVRELLRRGVSPNVRDSFNPS